MSRWRRWQREHGVGAFAGDEGPGPAGPRRRFELEDVALAAWVLVVEQVVARLLGSDPARWLVRTDGSAMSGHAVAETALGLALASSPTAMLQWLRSIGPLSWVAWLTLAGLVLVLLTRGKEDTTVDEGLARRILLTGPLYYVLALAVAMIATVRNLPMDETGQRRYPGFTTPPWLRRAAVVPAALLGQGAFRAHVGEFMNLGAETGAVQIVLEVVLLLAGFTLCVAGPRIAAGASRRPMAWVPRFLLFAGGVVLARFAGRAF